MGQAAAATSVLTRRSSAHRLRVRYVSIAFGPNGEVVEVVSSAGALTQFDAFGVHRSGMVS